MSGRQKCDAKADKLDRAEEVLDNLLATLGHHTTIGVPALYDGQRLLEAGSLD